jgi:hypothetical protein
MLVERLFFADVGQDWKQERAQVFQDIVKISRSIVQTSTIAKCFPQRDLGRIVGEPWR